MFPNNLRFLLQKKLNKVKSSFQQKENELFVLTCDDEVLRLISNHYKHMNGYDERSFFKIEWLHNGRIIKSNLVNSRHKIENNRLFINKTSVQDSGVYICTANNFFLEHRVIADFASIIIATEKSNFYKFPGEKLTIPCNGLVIKSLFQKA